VFAKAKESIVRFWEKTEGVIKVQNKSQVKLAGVVLNAII